MKKILLVIDVQHDFVDGTLGTPEARAIMPAVIEKINTFEGEVIFTRDTHDETYPHTQEGRNLPVTHCVYGTPGWELMPELEAFRLEKGCKVYDKPIFGDVRLIRDLAGRFEAGEIDRVTVIGLCTDICVVSNALMLKSACPELVITLDAACCAGVTPEKHAAALATMQSCQIGME